MPDLTGGGMLSPPPDGSIMKRQGWAIGSTLRQALNETCEFWVWYQAYLSEASIPNGIDSE